MSCFDLFGSLFSVHNTPAWGEGCIEFVEEGQEEYIALAHFDDGEVPLFVKGVASIPVTNSTGLWGWGDFSCKEDDLPPLFAGEAKSLSGGIRTRPRSD